jgi:hypothetical protein
MAWAIASAILLLGLGLALTGFEGPCWRGTVWMVAGLSAVCFVLTLPPLKRRLPYRVVSRTRLQREDLLHRLEAAVIVGQGLVAEAEQRDDLVPSEALRKRAARWASGIERELLEREYGLAALFTSDARLPDPDFRDSKLGHDPAWAVNVRRYLRRRLSRLEQVMNKIRAEGQ